MRSADLATLLRVPLLLILVYAIFVRFSAYAVVPLMLLLFASDAADGYLASSGRHSLGDFVSYLLEEGRIVSKRKERGPKDSPAYAANLDLAVDRLIEYALWLTFTLLQILPWFVIAIVFIRNTLADALLLRKGKSYSRLKSAFGRVASSHFSRGAYAVIKTLNFAYLSLVFVAGWPVMPAYVLTGFTVAFSLVRGAAEIYEALI